MSGGLFPYLGKENEMETRVALIGIVVENLGSVERLNRLLHDYGQYIIGRMGIPYEKRNIRNKCGSGRSAGRHKRSDRKIGNDRRHYGKNDIF